MTAELVIGVDGGGTKTVAWLASLDAPAHSDPLGRGASGPGNPRAVAFELALANIGAAIDAAFTDAKLQPETVRSACLALAGADRAAERNRLQEWAASRLLATQLQVINDAEPILAAAPGGWGVALISGTGSFALGRNSLGETARCGGWGYLFGDEGSGYAIAVTGLRAAARSADGRGEPTILVDQFLQRLNIASPQELITTLYRGDFPRRQIANLADVVVEASRQDDAVAQRIIGQAAMELAEMVQALVRRLRFAPRQFSLALAGGVLVHCPDLRDAVTGQLTQWGCAPSVATLVADPVRGAVELARRAVATED